MPDRLSPLPPSLRLGASRWVVALALLGALAACNEEAALQSSALNGAYRVTSHTANLTSCDLPGEEVAAEERVFGFVFRINNDPADNVMMGAPCDDTDACTVYYESTIRLRQRAGGFLLPNGDDTAGWSGRDLSLIVQTDVEPQQCSTNYIERVLTSPAPGRVRLEERHHIRPVSSTADQVCNPDDLAEVGPCQRLIIYEADRL